MARPLTLYTLQWGDLSLETVCQKAKEFGYDGVELGLPDHVDVRRTDTAYYQGIKDLLKKYDLRLYACLLYTSLLRVRLYTCKSNYLLLMLAH